MDTAYAGRWGDAFDPPLAVSNNAIKFAYWIAEEMDKCWNVLDFAHPAHTLPAEAPDSSQAAAPAAAPAAEPVGIRATQRFERMLTNLRAKNVLDKDELETMFALSLSDVPKVATTLHAHAQVEGAPAEVYIALCKARTDFGLDVGKDFANLLCFVACLLLNALGLGKIVQTVAAPGGGRPNWFFCKRQVLERMHPALAELGFSDDSIPSLATYTAAVTASLGKPRPPRAPIIAWESFAEATWLLQLNLCARCLVAWQCCKRFSSAVSSTLESTPTCRRIGQQRMLLRPSWACIGEREAAEAEAAEAWPALKLAAEVEAEEAWPALHF
eukprot:s202_g17.t2